MPKVDIDALPVVARSSYPAAFDDRNAVRAKRALGDAGGLTQFGVNLAELAPGAMSSLRHWHDAEDEFVFVLEGELTLVEDEGETVLRAGDAATFAKGVQNGHHLINRSTAPAKYLEIGARVSGPSRVYYPDDDLHFDRDGGNRRFTKKSGAPY